MFVFTSFGANIESSTNDAQGPYVFKISGQIHHLIESWLPVDNDRSKFAQLYIYDTKNKINNRMSSFVLDDASKELTKSIIILLIQILDKTNKLVKIFRMVKHRFELLDLPSMKLRLIGHRSMDTNQYDFLTSTNIGALIVGDIGEYESGR